MRNLNTILKVLAGSAALATLVGACEEVDSRPASNRSIVVSPTTSSKVEPSSAPAPLKAVAVLPAPTPETVDPKPPQSAAVDEGTMKADELIALTREALSLGELDRALKSARLATRRAPNRSTAWNTLGRVQLRRGERQAAIESFEKAVELNPSSSYAQNNLGLALLCAGRYDDAVDALEEATELEPVEGYMWNNLGMAYEHLDRLDEARTAYRQAAELKAERAPENLARLEGVKTVLRTAKADVVKAEPLDLPAVEVPQVDGGGE